MLQSPRDCTRPAGACVAHRISHAMTARRIVYGAWRSLPRRTLGPAPRAPCTLCGALLQTNSFGTSAAVDAARTPPKSDAFRSDDAGTDKPHPYPSSEDAVDSRLFGDTDHKALIDEILRVDHAGEYGATRIYQGQMDVLQRDKSVFELLAVRSGVSIGVFHGTRRAEPCMFVNPAAGDESHGRRTLGKD